MNTLLYTLVFIILLTTLSFRHLQNFIEIKSMHLMYTKTFCEERNRKNQNCYKEWQKRQSEKKYPNKRLTNGRLGLETVSKNKDVFLPVLISLVRKLYQDQEFFIELSQEYPGFERPLLEYIVDHYKDEKNIQLTEHLTKIAMQDPLWKKALYKMITNREKPLSRYITVKNKTVNVYNAKAELLEALLGKILANNISLLTLKHDKKEHLKNLLANIKINGSDLDAKKVLNTYEPLQKN
jgi:hypothetical protein